LMVVLIEATLRLAGYGYPTSFFLTRQHQGTSVRIENPKFGWRFFPPSVARAPLPIVFQSPKPADTTRIFLFGESAAMGDPEPAYGFGRQLQRILQARHPASRIEVINAAMTAINSHVIREIARDCKSHQGDAWIIYAGNNEVVGPFGAGTVFGKQAPSLLQVRAVLALKSFRLGQALASVLGRAHEPKEWEGMELFLNNQVAASDPRLKRVYDNFALNLSSVIRMGRDAGAKMILCSVPVNLRDCPPFASAHSSDLRAADLRNWQDLFSHGLQAQSNHRYAEALAALQKAAQIDPAFAELIFQRGRCELSLGQTNQAFSDFLLARDLDTLRFRTDSHLNEIIRQIGTSTKVEFVDAEKELSVPEESAVPGDEDFYDHVHLNFSGNYKVAVLLAKTIEKQLFPSASPSEAFLSEADVARQLAFTDFDQGRVNEEMRLRLQQPPFSSQSNFRERDRRFEATLNPAAHSPLTDSVLEYRAALALAPDDWVLRDNFGRLLEATGNKGLATEEWTKVSQQLPDEPEAFFHLGNLAYDAGEYPLAEEGFAEAIHRRPSSIESVNGLGLVLAAEGRTNEAITQFQAALRMNPHYSAARVNMAVLLAGCGQKETAISEYQTVLRTDTNNVAAHVNLARLEIAEGKTNQAILLYTEALELRPDNPIAQFDLGNALAAKGRHAEALKHYAAAVDHQPAFADAQYNLALELSRTGNISEALPHFEEAVRLSPGHGEAHFNYGVALAKSRRYQEAAQQFEETLKVQPNHPSARSMLDRARQLAVREPQLP
jgi:tetratricopeptide (TPR) repeat protein